jgi:hypothetical protein
VLHQLILTSCFSVRKLTRVEYTYRPHSYTWWHVGATTCFLLLKIAARTVVIPVSSTLNIKSGEYSTLFLSLFLEQIRTFFHSGGGGLYPSSRKPLWPSYKCLLKNLFVDLGPASALSCENVCGNQLVVANRWAKCDIYATDKQKYLDPTSVQ